MFRSLLRLGLPKTADFKLGIFLAILEGTFAVALLACSAWLISAAAEQPPIMYLNMVIVGVRGFALGRAFFRYTQRLTLHNAAFGLLTKLRPQLFAAVAPNAPAGLGNLNRVDFANRMVADVDEVQNLSLRVAAPLVQTASVSLLTVLALGILAPTTTAWLWLLAALAVAFGLSLPIQSALSRAQSGRYVAERAKLHTATAQYLENLELLNSFNWGLDARAEIEHHENALIKANHRNSIVAGLGLSIFGLLSTVAVVATTAAGSNAVLSGQLDHRMLAVVALLPLAIFELAGNSQGAVSAWHRYRASGLRLIQELTKKPFETTTPSQGQIDLAEIREVSASDLSLCYPGSTVPTTPVTFAFSAGQTAVISGASGAGKTTIAYALAGFLHPTSGNLMINGLPLTSYTEESLRKRIGYLEQQPAIFAGTLRANLLIAKPAATDEELWAAVRRAGLEPIFVERQGLETQLGERGLAVSGGEAQRIALVRALLADFQLLIFDEPTANLDAETAAALWNDLANLTVTDPSRISVFISHQARSLPGTTVQISL